MAEKEYIEREAAVETLNALKPFLQSAAQERLMRRIIRQIGTIPAADVAPVRHGRWVVGKDHGDFGEAKCTACGGILLVKWSDRLSEYRYCPNCGAKMELEGGNT